MSTSHLPSSARRALIDVLETSLNLSYFTNQCDGSDSNSRAICSNGNSMAHWMAEQAAAALGLKNKEDVYLFCRANKLRLLDEGAIDSLDLPRA